MANIPPTQKEKMLLKILVKRFSKEKLFQELVDIQSEGMESNMVRNSAKLIGVEVPRRIDSQYLNYAINNYNKIRNNDFPSEFERMMTLDVQVSTSEIRRVSAVYGMTLPVLKSFSQELKEDVEKNIWDYNPEFEDDDTYDTEVVNVEIGYPEIKLPWHNVVIE